MPSILIKSTSVVGFMTLLSRMSGLVRDVVLANILGDRAAADVFFVAFRIPNFFRRMTAEGAFAGAFVPVFTDFREPQTICHSRQFLSLTLGWFGLALAIFSLIGIVGSPWMVKAMAWGFSNDPAKFALAVTATRITFPYLFFISLVAMAGAMLNACGRFAGPAATPIWLNLCLIWAAWQLVPALNNGPLGLAAGVLVAGVVQLLFQVPFLRRERLLVWPRLRKRKGDEVAAEGAQRVFHLMLPALFGVSVAQVNLLINTLLASFLATGSIAWLYYSDRLMEFPVGVFGIALATVILPRLSHQHATASPERFSRTLDWSMRWVFLVSVPATVALIIMAVPLISTIFYHGDFSRNGVSMAANSLIAYSLGLVPIILVKVLAPGYYARKDTRTPVRIGMIAVVVNIMASLVLFSSMQHVGLATATSLAALVNAGLLYSGLCRTGVLLAEPGWVVLLLQVSFASIVMGILLYLGMGSAEWWLDQAIPDRVLRLSWLVSVGFMTYFLVLLVSGVPLKSLLSGREAE